MSATASDSATVTTLDPTTGESLRTYDVHGKDAIDATLDRAVAAQRVWRARPLAERAHLVAAAARVLRQRSADLATLATREMGKTLVEAKAEVEKCAVGCDHYANDGARYLADTDVASTATRSYVGYRPLGVLLAIMPWNFPYWQVFRAAAPALVAGNVVVLKHAANVTGCALAIESVMTEAGFPPGCFATLVVAGRDMEAIVADPRVACVTLTGSEGAGSSVAAVAGKHLKKTVLELGGSDAFIVLADADIDAAAKMAVTSRFQNNGQSCIAAKRFIVEAPVYDAFLAAFARETRAMPIGNPLESATKLGPLARADLRDDLDRQVRTTIAQGGTLVTGGKPIAGAGNFYEPTIVSDVTPEMTMFREETFGPAAAVVRANDVEHAIELANDSPYGLGGNLWTRDIARATAIAARLETGGVFVNGMTASDARLPFGGVKRSGYGRELSSFGIHEFVNIQTVWIGPATRAATGASHPAVAAE
ncbi:MAG: NAD-dependent succinate-semialdehyde dehydrogenase [Vulcanimicrobiaceae bacterium]